MLLSSSIPSALLLGLPSLSGVGEQIRSKFYQDKKNAGTISFCLFKQEKGIVEEKIQYFLSAIGGVKGTEHNVMFMNGIKGDREREGSYGKKTQSSSNHLHCFVQFS